MNVTERFALGRLLSLCNSIGEIAKLLLHACERDKIMGLHHFFLTLKEHPLTSHCRYCRHVLRLKSDSRSYLPSPRKKSHLTLRRYRSTALNRSTSSEPTSEQAVCHWQARFGSVFMDATHIFSSATDRTHDVSLQMWHRLNREQTGFATAQDALPGSHVLTVQKQLKREEWNVCSVLLAVVLSFLFRLFLTMTPMRIPPSLARRQPWPSKGATSSK